MVKESQDNASHYYFQRTERILCNNNLLMLQNVAIGRKRQIVIILMLKRVR